MANKQKAWRTQAAAINERRNEGSREGTARSQKVPAFKILGSPSWLFMGLMMRAGLWDPMPVGSMGIGRDVPHVPTSVRPWYTKAWDKAKSFFK